jgi:hypothetical protein
MFKDTEEEKDKTLTLLSSIGSMAGLYYAFTKKKTFWGYVGYMALGGVLGSLAAHIIKSTKKDKSPTPKGLGNKIELKDVKPTIMPTPVPQANKRITN